MFSSKIDSVKELGGTCFPSTPQEFPAMGHHSSFPFGNRLLAPGRWAGDSLQGCLRVQPIRSELVERSDAILTRSVGAHKGREVAELAWQRAQSCLQPLL